jgi:hypothetical protein
MINPRRLSECDVTRQPASANASHASGASEAAASLLGAIDLHGEPSVAWPELSDGRPARPSNATGSRALEPQGSAPYVQENEAGPRGARMAVVVEQRRASRARAK